MAFLEFRKLGIGLFHSIHIREGVKKLDFLRDVMSHMRGGGCPEKNLFYFNNYSVLSPLA